MGSRRTKVALRRRAGITLAVWAIALCLLAVVSALPEGPTAALIVDDAHPGLGVAVHFDASGSMGHDEGNGRIAAYRYAFGDGEGTPWQWSPLAVHAYMAEGTFTATVTVLDLRNETGHASVTVHVTAVPPPAESPDLVPLKILLIPAEPHVNETVNLTVTVLNRGGANATSATVDAYDLRPDGSIAFLGSVPVPRPLRPSETEPTALPAFVAVQAGSHAIRAIVANVTPAEPGAAPHELIAPMEVLAPGAQPGSGTRGNALDVGPLALGLSAVAVAAMAGAGYLLLRPPPKKPLEPPPAEPPDQSPPPIWPQ